MSDVRPQAIYARLLRQLRGVEPVRNDGSVGLPMWRVAEMQAQAGSMNAALDTLYRGLAIYAPLGPPSHTTFGADITPGTSEVETVVCPQGWEPKVIGTDQFMCEQCIPSTSDPNGPRFCQQLPPVFKPGVIVKDDSWDLSDWALFAGAVMVVGAYLWENRR